MRLLLIAYEFPPVQAAQALRWYYLANELAACGVEVEVLAPRISDRWQCSGQLHPAVTVHRCFPGPFIGLSGWLAHRRGGAPGPGATPGRSGLERVYLGLRRALNQVLFPDVRTEWLPWASWRLLRLLRRRYDVVVSSHEPGVDLMLGLVAARRGIPWIADLADPLLAPYTPSWRRPLDRAFEGAVCRRADHLLVTTPRLADTLSARHGVPKGRFSVVTQGFSAEPLPPLQGKLARMVNSSRFCLVFTGNFYPGFRDPSELVAALEYLAPDRIRLVVVGENRRFASLFAKLGEQAVVLGTLPHREALALQRAATLVLNLGNQQADQVPGKLFEYFGAQRPILHVSGSTHDPAIALLKDRRRGVVVDNDRQAIRRTLEVLYDRWSAGRLDKDFDLGLDSVRELSWSEAAARVLAVCEHVCRA